MTTKPKYEPWQGFMTQVNPETGAMIEINESGVVVGLAVAAPNSEFERIINETIDRILPGWREAAGLTNHNERKN
jgi:hypothetical protein